MKLPGWLTDALRGAVFESGPDRWPNWGHTAHPVDWPALIEQHPDTLALGRRTPAAQNAASWAAITGSFELLCAIDPRAAIDVNLWVGTDARILIDPQALLTTFDVTAPVRGAIDECLVAGGQLRDAIHPPGDHARRRRVWNLSDT